MASVYSSTAGERSCSFLVLACKPLAPASHLATQHIKAVIGLQQGAIRQHLQRPGQHQQTSTTLQQVYPHHLHIRRRNLKTLNVRPRWFEYLLTGDDTHPVQRPPRGAWGHNEATGPLMVHVALLRQMLATLNSY